MAGETPVSTLAPGLVHTPLTPFADRGRIDFGLVERLVEFHIGCGADTLALPMHAGESVSLTDEEQRSLVEFAVKRARGRVAIIAHVSDAGTSIAVARARFAEAAGAAAIVATAPYYWTPPTAMLLQHFASIGAAVRLPFYCYNSPEEMPGTKITTELCLKLLDRLSNFAGVVDLSLDWQFMIELLTYAPRRAALPLQGRDKASNDFQLIAGTEHMVSAAAIGARALMSPLAAIAPRLVRRLYDLCRNDELAQARPAQEALAALRQCLKSYGVAGLKAASRAFGRDCGEPRPPLLPLDAAKSDELMKQLNGMQFLAQEPRGW